MRRASCEHMHKKKFFTAKKDDILASQALKGQDGNPWLAEMKRMNGIKQNPSRNL